MRKKKSYYLPLRFNFMTQTITKKINLEGVIGYIKYSNI